MVSWRAVVTALGSPLALLVVGLVPGAVAAGLAPPESRSGLVHGALAGTTVTLGTWLTLYSWLVIASLDRVAPGFGISVALIAAWALVSSMQSLVAGSVVGLVR